MIVIDASAIVEVLLQKNGAEGIEARIFRPGETLHCPHLLDLEVMQALRRCFRNRELDGDRSLQAIADLEGLPLKRYAHDPFLGRIWDLRQNLTAYDACYVALAEALDAPLLTCDSRLASAPGHRAVVEVL